MVHAFQMKDKYIALDVNSGCVHVLDKLCYDIIRFLCDHDLLPEPEVFEKTVDQLGRIYQRDALQEGWDEIKELYANGVLFSADEYADIAVNMKRHSPVKAMCLHVAHDCNLRCAYCFADEGAETVVCIAS